MAELVYWIKNGQGLSKFGVTTNLKERFRMIKGSSPFASVFNTIETEYSKQIENNLKIALATRNVGGEWYLLTDEDEWFIQSHWAIETLQDRKILNLVTSSWLIRLIQNPNEYGNIEWVKDRLNVDKVFPITNDNEAIETVKNSYYIEIAQLMDYIFTITNKELPYDVSVKISDFANSVKPPNFEWVLEYGQTMSNR